MKRTDIKYQYINGCSFAGQIRSERVLSCDSVSTADERSVIYYPNPLSNFDMDVADAVYTIYRNLWSDDRVLLPQEKDISQLSGIEFTTLQLLHVLSGDFRQHMTADIRKSIEGSIETLRHTGIILQKDRETAFRLVSIDPGKTSAEEKAIPFLRLSGGNGQYCIETDASTPWKDTEKFFLPLYGWAAKKGKRRIYRFSPLLLSFETVPSDLPCADTDLPQSTRRCADRRNIQYIQIRRYLIRRIEWNQYRQWKKHKAEADKQKADRNTEECGDDSGKTKAHSFGIPRYSDSVRIVYQRRPHVSRRESAICGDEAGLLPLLGIRAQDIPDRALWRHRKAAVHRTVCRILDEFSALNYIRGYEEIKVPAVYRRSGMKKVVAADYHTLMTRLEYRRKSIGMSRWELCKRALQSNTASAMNNLFRRLELYEWRMDRIVWTEGEWNRFAQVLDCRVEEIKEPVRTTKLESARLDRGWSREELAAELTFSEFALLYPVEKADLSGNSGHTDSTVHPESHRQAVQTENMTEAETSEYRRKSGQSIEEWLYGLKGARQDTDWEERYKAHLEFIANHELCRDQKDPEFLDPAREWELLASALSYTDGGEIRILLPGDLKDRKPNLAVYGVSIRGTGGYIKWRNRSLK